MHLQTKLNRQIGLPTGKAVTSRCRPCRRLACTAAIAPPIKARATGRISSQQSSMNFVSCICRYSNLDMPKSKRQVTKTCLRTPSMSLFVSMCWKCQRTRRESTLKKHVFVADQKGLWWMHCHSWQSAHMTEKRSTSSQLCVHGIHTQYRFVNVAVSATWTIVQDIRCMRNDEFGICHGHVHSHFLRKQDTRCMCMVVWLCMDPDMLYLKSASCKWQTCTASVRPVIMCCFQVAGVFIIFSCSHLQNSKVVHLKVFVSCYFIYRRLHRLQSPTNIAGCTTLQLARQYYLSRSLKRPKQTCYLQKLWH